MPYVRKWVPPEKFLTREGPYGPVHVYHVYKDNEGRRLTYWYTTDECESHNAEFDVRELPSWRSCVWDGPHGVVVSQASAVFAAVTDAIVEAISTGELKPWRCETETLLESKEKQ